LVHGASAVEFPTFAGRNLRVKAGIVKQPRKALKPQRGGKNFECPFDCAGDLVGKYAGSKHSSHKRNLKGFGSGNRNQ